MASTLNFNTFMAALRSIIDLLNAFRLPELTVKLLQTNHRVFSVVAQQGKLIWLRPPVQFWPGTGAARNLDVTYLSLRRNQAAITFQEPVSPDWHGRQNETITNLFRNVVSVEAITADVKAQLQCIHTASLPLTTRFPVLRILGVDNDVMNPDGYVHTVGTTPDYDLHEKERVIDNANFPKLESLAISSVWTAVAVRAATLTYLQCGTVMGALAVVGLPRLKRFICDTVCEEITFRDLPALEEIFTGTLEADSLIIKDLPSLAKVTLGLVDATHVVLENLPALGFVYIEELNSPLELAGVPALVKMVWARTWPGAFLEDWQDDFVVYSMNRATLVVRGPIFGADDDLFAPEIGGLAYDDDGTCVVFQRKSADPEDDEELIFDKMLQFWA